MVGLACLLCKHRDAVLHDIEEQWNYESKSTKYLHLMKDVLRTDDVSIFGMMDVMVDIGKDYRAALEEDCRAEKVLIASHLRRLRGLYVVLLGICERDGKLLAW